MFATPAFGTPVLDAPPPPPVFAPPPPTSTPFTVVEQTPVAPPMSWPTTADPTAQHAPTAAFQPPYAEDPNATTAWPAEPVPPVVPVPAPSRRNGVALAIFAGLAGMTTIVASFLPVLKLSTDAAVLLPLGEFKRNDIHGGTNLQVAILVAGIVFLFGGILANFGQRIGAGLVGGTALTLCAYVAYIYGLVIFTSDQTENAATASAAGSGGGTFFESTISVGMFVLVAACAIGIIALFICLSMSGLDGARTLNRIVCVAGAIASLAAAGGQMIPENGYTFSDNFDTDMSTTMITYSRLAIIGLVAICGVAGFLRSNRWGIGLAIGGASIYLWQWISSIAGFGEFPVPPAFGNPGATISDLKPTIVTTLGLIAMLVLAVVAFAIRTQDEHAHPT